jgi:hypothetical protein
MKRSIATLAFASVLLSSAAYAQSTAEKTGVNSTLGIAPRTDDFIKEAAMSDMLEIDAAKIAQQKGDSPGEDVCGRNDHGSHQDQHRVEGDGLRRNEGRASHLA